MLEFIQDPDPVSPFFVFAGFAGTGKTFCMREVAARLAPSHCQIAYTAPTNKAAKVLRGVTGAAQTIFSLLGLRIDKSGELKQLVSGKPPENLKDLDVVFLDEASMVNDNLMKELTIAVKRDGFRVVFMGDEAQLPPVKEATSPVWKLPVNARLTKVMRHDNEILELVTDIREVINSPAPCINIKSKHHGDTGIWKMTKMGFKESIYNAAMAGGFADGGVGKVIAWRNMQVDEYNALIRNALWGAGADFYVPGERIVAAAPLSRGEEQLMMTDEEAVVESVAVCKHPLEPKYMAYELKCRTEDNRTVRLITLHPSSRHVFESDCQALAHDAAAMPKLWKKFWELKDIFHDIKYAYAITAHRSQGSTYQNVWVDYQDILRNRNRKEAFQCLYVACSRPTTKLMLA